MTPPKSKLWLYFSKVNKDTVKCKSCSKILKSSGNTTNMKKHLIVKHGISPSSADKGMCYCKQLKIRNYHVALQTKIQKMKITQ